MLEIKMVINGKVLTGPCTPEEFGAISANLFGQTKKFINMPANIMKDTVIRMDAIDYISLEDNLSREEYNQWLKLHNKQPK